MWHDDRFSQRNKATKREGLKSVGQNLKRERGVFGRVRHAVSIMKDFNRVMSDALGNVKPK